MNILNILIIFIKKLFSLRYLINEKSQNNLFFIRGDTVLIWICGVWDPFGLTFEEGLGKF